MQLHAEFLAGRVNESTFYDMMGTAKQGWAVEMKVMDVETDETYDVQIVEGYPLLEELKERKRKGEPVDVLRQIAAELEAQLPQRHEQMQLQVLKFKGKQVAFIKLVCRLVGVGAAV